MIKFHIETKPDKEEWVEYEAGISYNFTHDNNWIGVFDNNGALIASVATKYVVRIESTENPIPSSPPEATHRH